jgi:hypothetical protein
LTRRDGWAAGRKADGERFQKWLDRCSASRNSGGCSPQIFINTGTQQFGRPSFGAWTTYGLGNESRGEEAAMRFFTRELFERRQSEDDVVLEASEEEWECALDAYDRHLQAMAGRLPAHIRQFQELLLHDALVLSIGRQGNRLIMILRQHIPPRDLVIASYDLEGEPVLEKFSRNARDWSRQTDFNFDEFDVIDQNGQTLYLQEIVFSNGWLLRLRIRDLSVTRAAPVYPIEHGAAVPNLSPAMAQSA